MDVEPKLVAVWAWVIVAVAAGSALSILGGSTYGTAGVVLIILGLISIMPALQVSLD